MSNQILPKHSKLMETFCLVGTEEELSKFRQDMAKIGWRLTFRGHSGGWLGEVVYEVKSDGSDAK